MTVTTPVADLLSLARRYEAEGRWSQSAAAYQQAIDNTPHPTSTLVADDLALLRDLHRQAVWRSQLAVSTVATPATEDAKAAFDKQGEQAYAKREAATSDNPKT